MTPPLTCGIQSETFHRIESCEPQQPVCTIPVPTLIEDQEHHLSRVVDIAYCAEELHRMSPPPSLVQVFQRISRRHQTIPLRPQPPAPRQQRPTPPPQPHPSTPPTMNAPLPPAAPVPVPQTSSQTGSVSSTSHGSLSGAAAAGAAAGLGAALGAAAGSLLRGAARAFRSLSR